MLTWIIAIFGIMLGLPLLVILIGSLLPGEFSATVTASMEQPVNVIWSAITDHAKHPMSARMCRGIEPLPSENGLPCWREDMGSSRVRVQTIESIAPSRLIREMHDEMVPMRIRCEYTVKPVANGSEVTATIRGTISKGTWHVPIFKFMIHIFGGAKSGQRQFLQSLNKT